MINVFLPVSRRWVLPQWEENLSAVLDQIEHEEIALLVMIDSDDKSFLAEVNEIIDRIEESGSFGCRKCVLSGRKPIAEDAHILERRQRVIEIWTEVKEHLIDAVLLFSMEDDTLCLPYTLLRLRNLLEITQASYVSGIQAHRRKIKGQDIYPLGAWHIGQEKAHTLGYVEDGTQEVNGAGLYCFMTYTDFVRDANFREEGAAMGPDVCFVYDLWKKGLPTLIDWSVVCGHLQEDGTIITPGMCRGRVEYYRETSEDDWVPKIIIDTELES